MGYKKQGLADGDCLCAHNIEKIEDGIIDVEKEVALRPKTINGVAPDENGNIDVAGGGSITTDTTFSIPGAAADAAAVGAALADAEQAFGAINAALTTQGQQIQANTEAVAKVKMPEVTEADNGKFLRVTDGAWAAVSVESAEEASF